MKTLDKSRPFGIVYGDREGRCYEQDGAFFDSQGKPWGAKQAPADDGGEVDEPEAPRRGRKPKQAPADEQLAAQLEG